VGRNLNIQKLETSFDEIELKQQYWFGKQDLFQRWGNNKFQQHAAYLYIQPQRAKTQLKKRTRTENGHLHV